MRTSQTMTVSLPPAMIKEVERVRKTERRTRSELVREALRLYFGRARELPVYTPTPRELREIEKSRAEMRRGEFVSLDDLFRNLVGPRAKKRQKGHRARAQA